MLHRGFLFLTVTTAQYSIAVKYPLNVQQNKLIHDTNFQTRTEGPCIELYIQHITSNTYCICLKEQCGIEQTVLKAAFAFTWTVFNTALTQW